MQEIKVKRVDKNLSPLTYTGDWVDVRVSAVVENRAKHTEKEDLERSRNAQKHYDGIFIMKGDTIKVYHGFCLELPLNHEADLRPRSSLARTHGLIFTSSGVIDEGYNGDDDEWFSTFYATRDCELGINERICQFRIQEKQPELQFNNVSHLGNANRGGHGSTGDF